MSVTFAPDTYRSGGGDWHNGSSDFAHANAGAKTLVLEQREDGGADVTITYQLNGKTIVERWTADPLRGEIPWTNPPRPVPRVSISPGTVDYGVVPVGEQRDAIFTVENVGIVAGPPVFTLDGEFDGLVLAFSSNGCLLILDPGKTCAVTVRFRPRKIGVIAAGLKVRIEQGPEATAALTGVGAVADAGGPDTGPGDGGAD
jgi:hypothetical protein